MTFGEKLGTLIERHGKSQSVIAREVGLPPSAISAIVAGIRRPYLDQAAKIARALGMSLDELADDSFARAHKNGVALPIAVSQLVERPTCKTCSYWLHDEEEDVEERGRCKRLPPLHTFAQSMPNDAKELLLCGDADLGFWPETDSAWWCGEHPDFPEYIACRKRTDAT